MSLEEKTAGRTSASATSGLGSASSVVLVYLRSMGAFALVWYAAAKWIGNPVLLPDPIQVVQALYSLLLSGDVVSNAASSLRRLAVSFVAACATGIALGLLMGMNRVVFSLFDPLIELLRPISGIAWIPLGMFFLGVGEALPTAIMFYGAFFPIVINTIVGVRSVDAKLVQAAEVLGVDRWSIVANVILPASLPNILVGLRLGAGAAWTAMVAAELIGAPSGLGFAVEWYRQLLMTPSVLAFVFLIGLFGYLLDRLLRAVQAVLTPWAASTGGLR